MQEIKWDNKILKGDGGLLESKWNNNKLKGDGDCLKVNGMTRN